MYNVVHNWQQFECIIILNLSIYLNCFIRVNYHGEKQIYNHINKQTNEAV